MLGNDLLNLMKLAPPVLKLIFLISYSYFSLPDKLSQTAEIKSVKPGIVENIGIITGGSNYQIGDKAIFDNVNIVYLLFSLKSFDFSF